MIGHPPVDQSQFPVAPPPTNLPKCYMDIVDYDRNMELGRIIIEVLYSL